MESVFATDFAHMASHLMGKASQLPLPSPILQPVIRAYAVAMGVSMEEIEQPLSGFKNFGEFFGRRLRPGARVVCEDGGAISKVIIEAALLTDDEKVRACELSKKARANFVKTSTGFGPHGATAEDVALMSGVVASAGIGVKAAGGIRSFEDAHKMISAGATRVGASAGIKIVQRAKEITISN